MTSSPTIGFRWSAETSGCNMIGQLSTASRLSHRCSTRFRLTSRDLLSHDRQHDLCQHLDGVGVAFALSTRPSGSKASAPLVIPSEIDAFADIPTPKE